MWGGLLAAVLLAVLLQAAPASGAWRVNDRWSTNCSIDDSFEPNPGTLASDPVAAAAASAAAVERLRVLVEPAEPTAAQWAAAALGPWVEAPVFSSVLTQGDGWRPLPIDLYLPMGCGSCSAESQILLPGLFLCVYTPTAEREPGNPDTYEADAFVVGVRANATYDLAPGLNAGTGLVRTLLQMQLRFAQAQGWMTLNVDKLDVQVDAATGGVTSVVPRRVVSTEELAPHTDQWDDRQITSFLADVADSAAGPETLAAEPLGGVTWYRVEARMEYLRLFEGGRYDLEVGFGDVDATCGASGRADAALANTTEVLVLQEGRQHNSSVPNALAPAQGFRVHYEPAVELVPTAAAAGAQTGSIRGTITPCRDALYEFPLSLAGAENVTIWTAPVVPRFGDLNSGVGDGQLVIEAPNGWTAAATCPSCEGEYLLVPDGTAGAAGVPLRAHYTMGVKTAVRELDYVIGWTKCDWDPNPPPRSVPAPAPGAWAGGASQATRVQLCGDSLVLNFDLGTALADAAPGDGLLITVSRWALDVGLVSTPSMFVDVFNSTGGSIVPPGTALQSRAFFLNNEVFVPNRWFNNSNATTVRVELRPTLLNNVKTRPRGDWVFPGGSWPYQPPASDLQLNLTLQSDQGVTPGTFLAPTPQQEALYCNQPYELAIGNTSEVVACPNNHTTVVVFNPLDPSVPDVATGYDMTFSLEVVNMADGTAPLNTPVEARMAIPAISAVYAGTDTVTFLDRVEVLTPSRALAPFSPNIGAPVHFQLTNIHGVPITVRATSSWNGCTPDFVDGVDNGETQFQIRRSDLPRLERDPVTGQLNRPNNTLPGLRACRGAYDFFAVPLDGADSVTFTMHFVGLGPIMDEAGRAFYTVTKLDAQILDPITDVVIDGQTTAEATSYWGHSFTFNVTEAARPPTDLVYLRLSAFSHASIIYDLDVVWRGADSTTNRDVLLGPGGTPWADGPPEPLPPPPPPAPATTEDPDEFPIPILWLVFMIAGVLLCLLLLVILGAVLINRRTRERERAKAAAGRRSQPTVLTPGGDGDLDDDDYGTMASHMSRSNRSRDELELSDLMSIARQLEDVKLESKIGEGNFGAVWKAKWKGTPIAAKTVENVREIADELAILTKLDHPNVVHFLGVSSTVCPGEEEPRDFMVFELAQDSVLGLMQRQEVSMQKKIQMLRDAGRGVAYINGLGIVHRDLACRNLLYDRDRVLISDFGLSRKYEGDFYKTDSQRSLPVRWSAPEVLKQGEATTASDTFSFATLMWELMEDAATPFAGLSNTEVMRVALAGRVPEHLTQPDGCPDELYAMMQKMWNPTPKERPPMEEVLEVLDAILAEEGGQVSGYESKVGTPSVTSPDPSAYRRADYADPDDVAESRGTGGASSAGSSGAGDKPDHYGSMPGESEISSLASGAASAPRNDLYGSMPEEEAEAEQARGPGVPDSPESSKRSLASSKTFGSSGALSTMGGSKRSLNSSRNNLGGSGDLGPSGTVSPGAYAHVGSGMTSIDSYADVGDIDSDAVDAVVEARREHAARAPELDDYEDLRGD